MKNFIRYNINDNYNKKLHVWQTTRQKFHYAYAQFDVVEDQND